MNLKNTNFKMVDISDPVQYLNNLMGQVELASNLSMANYKLIMRTRLGTTIKFGLLAAFTYYVYDNLNRRMQRLENNVSEFKEFETE